MFSGVAPPPCRWHMLQLEILKHVWLRGTLNENRRKETEFWGKLGISFMMLGWLHSVRKLTADWTLEYSGVVSKEWPHVRECNHVTMLIEGVKLLLSIRCILVPCSLCPYTEDSRWLSDKHSVPHTSHFWSRVTCWDKWQRNIDNETTYGGVVHFCDYTVTVLLLLHKSAAVEAGAVAENQAPLHRHTDHQF